MPEDNKTHRSRRNKAWLHESQAEVIGWPGGMWRRLVLLVVLCLGFSQALQAADEEPAPVHWAYSAFFGTGWYTITDNRSVFIFRIPPRQTIRRASFDDTGKRRYGLEIHYLATLGLHNIDDIPGIIEPDNFGTFSFTPGVTVEIPVTRRWSLRPNFHFGWGKEYDSGETAWIYQAGVKSRYTFGADRVKGGLLGALNYAGYNPSVGESSDLASFTLGVEFYQPLRWKTGGGDSLRLNWHLTYDWVLDDIDFIRPRQESTAIKDQWELGLALSKGDKPLRLWFINFEHVGLALRWSSGGEFKAITVNLRSPFTR
jgi:hypothetical protein